MKLRCCLLACFVQLPVPLLRADVTLRYETKITSIPALVSHLEATIGSRLPVIPKMYVRQFRNGKMHLRYGATNFTIDVATKQITLLDDQGKRYTTVGIGNYANAIGQAFSEEGRAMLESAHVRVESSSGNKAVGTATILGIEAEDHRIVLTQIRGAAFRLAMHVWTPKESETRRVRALREVAGYDLTPIEGFNALDPLETLQKLFEQSPAIRESLASIAKRPGPGRDSIWNGSIMLRAQFDVLFPAATANRLGVDPDSPLMQINDELKTISTDPIADSVFGVPEDYRQVNVAQIARGTALYAGIRGQTVSVKSGQADGANQLPFNMVLQTRPVYPPEAKAAGVQGTVKFTAVINKDGTVRSLQLTSGPPPLVQPAMDAVWHWVYKPTLQNGEPIDVTTTIEVPFRLQ